MWENPGSIGIGSTGAVLFRKAFMSGASVDRLADRRVALGHLEKALRVAEEQQVAGALQCCDAGKQLALGVLVEIDHDVPAEDGIQWAFHGQRMHEIELLECDERTKLGRH